MSNLITPGHVVAHARRLITVEIELAQRAVQQFQSSRTTYLGTHGVLELCRDRISTYAEAFAALLEAFGQYDAATDIRQQGSQSDQALNRLVSALQTQQREGFDTFGQPSNGPVIGEEFRAQAASPAQSSEPNPASCARQIQAAAQPFQSPSPDLSTSPADRPDQAPRSGTA